MKNSEISADISAAHGGVITDVVPAPAWLTIAS